MAVNPPQRMTADDVDEYVASLSSDATLEGVLLQRLGVVTFPGAALGLDDFSDECLSDRYRPGFEMDEHTMVFVGGLYNHLFLFDSLEQMLRLRGEFGPEGIREALAIPTDLWEKVQGDLPIRIRRFC